MRDVMLHENNTRRIVLALFSVASLAVRGGVTQAQQPTADDFIAQADYCSFTGLCGNGGQSQVTTTHLGVDPCYLAQNAMRPCTSADMKALQPHGVDPNLVGTWELPLKGGRWVLSIDTKGNYTFHSEAQDGVPSHAGSFAASNGAWSMNAKTGYAFAGGGNYLYQAPDIFIATTQQGAVAWLRPALAQTAMHCAVKPQKTANPATLDAHLIGTWQLPVKGGNWVWEIAGDGSYKFHSEATDGAPSHAGIFNASANQWTLTATSGIPYYADNGQYLYQTPNIWMVKGKLGGAAWIRRCNP
jgi:hypothetical protein